LCRTPIVHQGSMTIAQSLVTAGVSVNATNNEGETPLHLAVLSNSSVDIVFLLTLGADINMRMKRGGLQPSHLLVANRNATVLPMLSTVNAQMNAPCYLRDRPTPLMLATETVRLPGFLYSSPRARSSRPHIGPLGLIIFLTGLVYRTMLIS